MKPILLLLALGVPAAPAQSTISPADRHAYGPNFGWIDFRPSAADGLVVNEATLSGHAWSPNFGWLYFGDHQTLPYDNTTAGNFGVNLAADGKLTGFAWSPNVGWIQFEQTHGQPRIDLITGQFHGHAWSANAGWIYLDSDQSGMRTTSISIADSDNDGLGDAWEMQHFGNLTFSNATTNADSDPASDLDEYRAATAPHDAADWLQLVSQTITPAANTITLRFTTAPARLYRIESSPDLQGAWSVAPPGTFAPDAGAVTEKTFTLPSGPRRFFRVTSVRPLQ